MQVFIYLIFLLVGGCILFLFYRLHEIQKKPINDAIEIFNYSNDIFESNNLTKYYKSDEFDRRLEENMKRLIPNHMEHKKAKQLLTYFFSQGDVFTFGGVVRDIINNENPNDFDLKIETNNTEKIRKICSELQIDFDSLFRLDKTPTCFKKIKFFGDIFDVTKIEKVRIENFENDINSMHYDLKNRVIIDPSGTGLINCINKRFQLTQPTFDLWFNSVWENKPKHGLAIRIFKMFKKGYTLVEEDDKTLDNYRKWFKINLKIIKNKNQYFQIPILLTECFLVCRGDKIDPKTLTITKKGRNHKNLKELLHEIKKFDLSIYYEIVQYLSTFDPSVIQYIE
jgi:hypothetical protein